MRTRRAEVGGYSSLAGLSRAFRSADVAEVRQRGDGSRQRSVARRDQRFRLDQRESAARKIRIRCGRISVTESAPSVLRSGISPGASGYSTNPLESGENAGDTQKTFESFLAEDGAVNEQFIEEIGERADFTIQNNGSFERFKEKAGYFIFSEIVITRLLQKKCC